MNIGARKAKNKLPYIPGNAFHAVYGLGLANGADFVCFAKIKSWSLVSPRSVLAQYKRGEHEQTLNKTNFMGKKNWRVGPE
jgi:hypothetical protein